MFSLKGARIKGPHATTKGLRHEFGIKAVTTAFLSISCRSGSGTPDFPQRYDADATGSEAKQIAERMWTMADIEISQAEADALIAMEKQPVDDEKEWNFPSPGEALNIPLTSTDKRDNFNLDVTRGRIKLTKATYQNRARQAIILMRLDLDGPPHRNPDAEEIPALICISTGKDTATNGRSRPRPTYTRTL